MRPKRPFVASLDQVKITRVGEEAIIEYADPGVWTTHFRMGPKINNLSDQEILDLFNEHIEASEQLRKQYEHVAIEIPPGKPQIEYDHTTGRWISRGDVLRCQIASDAPDIGPTIYIDEQELSWEEFGRLLDSHEGWGMRLVFVPDDELHLEPEIEVREPQEEEP
ncbi:MAG: hypothetical protein JW797_03215 [Bradymonadales bacterium]|nr:hypothetical protein [Bradymonadales bacterium]